MVLWSKSSNYGEKLRCHACDERTDEQTDGGKWKIGQCSVRPETAKKKPRYVIFGQVESSNIISLLLLSLNANFEKNC